MPRLAISDRLRAAASVAVCALLIALVAINVRWAYDWRPDELLDLGSFLHSAASYDAGLNPYVSNPGVSPPPLEDGLNLNPPVTVHLFRPLTGVDPKLLDRAFFFANLVLLAATLALLRWKHSGPVWPGKLIAAFAMAGVTQILAFGQIYAPLVLASAGAFILLERGRSVEAGICIGLIVAIKPNFVLWPLLLLVAGYPAVAASALVTAAAFSLVPLIIDGVGIYEQWLDAAWAFEGFSRGNAALRSLNAALDVPRAVIYVASGLVVAAAAYVVYWRRPDALATSSLAIVTTLLVGPASWPGYILFLWPMLLARHWAWLLCVAMLMFLEPGWMAWPDVAGISQLESVFRGITYTLGLLVLFAVLTRSITDATEPEAPGLWAGMRGLFRRRTAEATSV
jgi:alpha-1,2-mannosyltransferase